MSIIDNGYAGIRREHTLDVAYGAFTAGLESRLGTMKASALELIDARGAEQAKKELAAVVGSSGFAIFQKIDHGALLRAFAGDHARATTYVFGNALFAIEMTRHVPYVGLYVPLRMYVRELDAERTAVTYDRLSPAVAQFRSPEASAVAETIDAKVSALIDGAAASARAHR
jgi:uncharacterized protein (DUF302 family)